MIRIGIVGIGFMGWIHYLALRKVTGASLVAICSRDEKKRQGVWTAIRGIFGPPGEIIDVSGLKVYADYDAMLADPDIDLVDVCNPTHLHPDFTIKALQAGKHVLVEKAIALTQEDADRMVQAANQSGKILMVAHVLPFFPEFAFAVDSVRSGKYGKLVGAHFRRVISKPDWSAEIGDVSLTGGPAVDLHIHDTHFIGLICGVPEKVFSTGIEENGAVSYLTTSYLYDSRDKAVTCSSGAVSMKAREFVHGYEIYLEKATLIYESGTVPLTILHEDGSSEQPTLTGGDDPVSGFTREIQAAVDGITANKAPDLLSGQLARDALVLCHKECESVRTGQPVSIS
ncbi:MAG: Gfo/Idh/MocA family protein [Gemmataceae bacterium]